MELKFEDLKLETPEISIKQKIQEKKTELELKKMSIEMEECKDIKLGETQIKYLKQLLKQQSARIMFILDKHMYDKEDLDEILDLVNECCRQESIIKSIVEALNH